MKRDKNYKAWVEFIFWKTVLHMYGRHELKEVIHFICIMLKAFNIIMDNILRELVVRYFLNWLVRNELHSGRVVRVAWTRGIITNIKMTLNFHAERTSCDKSHLGTGCVLPPLGSLLGQTELEREFGYCNIVLVEV